jgi:hypothetical protein
METVNHHVNLSPRYGISIAVISIIFTVIFFFTRTFDTIWTSYFVNLVMFLGILFSIIHYNSQHHERTSAIALFSMGFRTTMWAVAISAVFTIVLQLIARTGHEDNFWIFLITNSLFINIILGLLASALGAMAFKRNQKTERPE